MRNRITKQVKEELKLLIDKTGYWSEQTREYISQFDYPSNRKLHTMAMTYEKYHYGL